MENELFKKVYQMVQRIGNNKTLKRATYSNADIVAIYLWAVLHDRPTYWACKKASWLRLCSLWYGKGLQIPRCSRPITGFRSLDY